MRVPPLALSLKRQLLILLALVLAIAFIPMPHAQAIDKTETSWSIGDFESGGTLAAPGWTSSSLSGANRAVAATTKALSGSYGMRIDDGSTTVASSTKSSPVRVTGGSTYLFHAYAYSTEGASAQTMTVRYYDSAGKVVATFQEQTTDAAMMWNRLLIKAPAPSNAVRADVTLSSSNSGTGTVMWDALDFIRPMFFNGQFENTPSSSTNVPWWTVNNTGGVAQTTTDENSVRAGNRALHLKTTNTSSPSTVTSTEVSNGLRYMPRVFPSITHDFTGWVKPISGTPKLVVTWYDKNMKEISSSYSVITKPKGEWSYYKAQLAAPENAMYSTLTLTAKEGAASEAYWDEMGVTPTPPAPKPTYAERSLGEPVARDTTHVSNATTLNGVPVIYSGVNGSPAHLEILDFQNNKVLRDIAIPGSDNLWGMQHDDKGNIYVGSNNGHLYRVNMSTSAVQDLGAVAAGKATMIFDLEIDSSGVVWGTTTNSSQFFKYDPAANKITNLGSASSTDSHARALAVTDSSVFVGVGPTNPRIIKYDKASGAMSTITLPAGTSSKFVVGLDTLGNYLTVKGDASSTSYRLYDWVNSKWAPLPKNAGGQELNNQAPMPVSAQGEFYYTSYKQILGVNATDLTTSVKSYPTELLYSMRDRSIIKGTIGGVSGEWIILHDGNKKVSAMHVGTWQVKTWPVDWKPVPLLIKSLMSDNMSTLFAGGYGAPSLAKFSPAATGSTTYPLNPDNSSDSIIGEVEGGIYSNGYQFFGSYTQGKIFRYNPAQPWVDGTNPTLIAKIYGQDRPMAWATAGSRTFFGTVPTYGKLGGVLGIMDTPTSAPRTVSVSPDRSVTDLATRGNIVYGSTSVWGGIGSTPTQSSGTVFAYDPDANKKIWEVTPEIDGQSVGSIAIAPNGNVWVGVGWNLYEMSPNSGAVLRKVSLRSDIARSTSLAWNNTNIEFIGQRMYYSVGSEIYSVDTTNLHIDRVANNKSRTNTATQMQGKLYYENYTRAVEVTPSNATVTTTAFTPYRLDRCGMANDKYVIPYEPGVTYFVDGVRKDTGNYSTGGRTSVTVTAAPQTGWSLAGAKSWTLDFTNSSC